MLSKRRFQKLLQFTLCNREFSGFCSANQMWDKYHRALAATNSPLTANSLTSDYVISRLSQSNAIKVLNQSKFEAELCNRCWARESGFGMVLMVRIKRMLLFIERKLFCVWFIGCTRSREIQWPLPNCVLDSPCSQRSRKHKTAIQPNTSLDKQDEVHRDQCGFQGYTGTGITVLLVRWNQ